MMTVRRLDLTDEHYWDREIQRYKTAHPLNAFGWGNVRRIDNWIPIYLVAESQEKFRGAMMVLVKRLPLIPFSIMYSPKGPVWNYMDSEVLAALVDEVRKISKEENAIFLRLDPNIEENEIDFNEDPFLEHGFRHLPQRWTFWNSPRDVYRIDLTKVDTSEALYNMLDRDTRRCIRKAKREGVSIEAAHDEYELQQFFKIFAEFSLVKGFMIRSFEYQKRLWETFIVSDRGRLFLAKYKGRIIGGLICIMFGRKCLAMHMGTPYQYQKLQTYYAYVWESIKWAKEKDCEWYSFRGVGTTPSQEYFKSKFLPEVVNLKGYYDLPFRPFSYKLFYTLEFDILPRIWHTLMHFRKAFSKLKG